MTRHQHSVDVAAPRSEVWRTLTRAEAIGRACQDIASVEVTATNSDARESSWCAILLGAEMPWTQREWASKPGEVANFELVAGAPRELRGTCTLGDPDGATGTRITIDAWFDFGLPGTSAHLAHGFDRLLASVLRDVAASFDAERGA